eukprot:1191168-Prorocentrum_minimum.AAC.2
MTARPIRRRIRRCILTTDQSYVRVEPHLMAPAGCGVQAGAPGTPGALGTPGAGRTSFRCSTCRLVSNSLSAWY